MSLITIKGQTKCTFQWEKKKFPILLNIDLLFLWSAENNLIQENLTIAMKTKRQKKTLLKQ